MFYVYDLLPVQYPQFWPLEAQADILHHEWLSIVTSYDEVICISETTAKRCREFLEGKYPPRFPYRSRLERAPVRLGSRKAEISAIPLGCDFESEPLSKGLPENAEELLKKFRSKPTFLMVGTLEPRKGHRQMLEVFEQLWSQGEDVQLVIVGRHGWLMEDFVALLEWHSERRRRLFWLSDVNDEFLDKIYEACSCLLAASFDEGYGLPLVEAIQRDKPVLARDIEVFRETAESDVRYFQGNLDEITACIQKICQGPCQKNNDPRQPKNWQTHVRQLTEKIQNKRSPGNVENVWSPAREARPCLSLFTPHARHIYSDLKQAIERKKGKVLA
jgi:glycosyltransferase involved in cell wall biosynthesis